jgi:hypothetical protein
MSHQNYCVKNFFSDYACDCGESREVQMSLYDDFDMQVVSKKNPHDELCPSTIAQWRLPMSHCLCDLINKVRSERD